MPSPDLCCWERLSSSDEPGLRAEYDPDILGQEKVLKNLLQLESAYLPAFDYFQSLQRDIKPCMRKIVTSWMMEVCGEQSCEDSVFPLAVNFLDRFLCTCEINRIHLQLLGTVCLLVASKLRQCKALSIATMCYYTDYSVSEGDIKKWEVMLLSKLRWDMCSITGFDFIDHLLAHMNDVIISAHRRCANTILTFVITEEFFLRIPASVLAASCLLAALLFAHHPSYERTVPVFADLIRVKHCVLEDHVSRVLSCAAGHARTCSQQYPGPHPCLPVPKHEQGDSAGRPQETPTDIQDIFT